ncbi:MAG: GldG family protein [Mariprofundaceae bacterium]|nr:GldG family protein [Mariprofundaceae bacterium]
MAADQRMRIRTAAIGRLLLSIVCLAILYVAADASHWQSDWTEGQTSTLSASSKSLLRQLDEPLMIRAYITGAMPQPYGQLERYIEDLLQSMHEAGDGNIGYDIVDPSDDPNIAASLAALQIPKVQVQVIEDDHAQVKQGYLAIVIEFLDAKEIIPVVQSDQGLEYALMRKIKKLTGKGRVKLAIATGFGANNLDTMKQLSASIQEDYEVTSFAPAVEPVPDGTQVIIVAGVRQKVSDIWRYRLDQFRMQGGGLLVLAGQAYPDMRYGFQVLPIDPYANDWLLDDLGVLVESGLVMDQQASRITVNQQKGGFMFRSAVDYPFIPDVTDMNDHHPITRNIEGISIPFASPLATRNAQAQVLMRSSQYATVQQGPPFNVNPMISMEEQFSGLALNPSVLALVYEGAQDSAFTAPPEGIADDEGKHRAKTPHTRWLVVGSLALLDDQFMQGTNITPVLNMLDWLAGDVGLIDLRSRGVTHRPLIKLDSTERLFFKVLWMLGLPLLLLFLGLGRWWWLHRRRKSIQ